VQIAPRWIGRCLTTYRVADGAQGAGRPRMGSLVPNTRSEKPLPVRIFGGPNGMSKIAMLRLFSRLAAF
jgi:hypothetical protein